MLLLALIALVGANPTQCPPDVCGVDTSAASYEQVADEVRRMMLEAPRLSGMRPRVLDCELKGRGASRKSAVLRSVVDACRPLIILYGSCPSHGRRRATCSSASYSVSLAPSRWPPRPDGAEHHVVAPMHEIFQYSADDAAHLETVVWIQPDPLRRGLEVHLSGRGKLSRKVLEALPLRRLARIALLLDAIEE